MKTIAFYISDYGMGHASRSIALIRKILSADLNVRFFVKTYGPFEFVRKSLQDPRVRVLRCRNDPDIILQPGTSQVDGEKTYAAFSAWMDRWDEYIRNETEFCREHSVTGIISDITPQPFLVAHALGISGIAVSNFTWLSVYRELFGDSPSVERIQNAYLMASVAFVLPFSFGMDLFPVRIEIPLLARRVTVSRQDMRKKFKIPESDTVIYLGLGRIFDLSVDHYRNLPQRDGVTFLLPSGVPVPARMKVMTIPEEETESQNWLNMCDLIVTKCGYSSISEAVQSHIPLLVWKREGYIEDEILGKDIVSLGIGKVLPFDEIVAFSWLDDIPLIRKSIENFDIMGGLYQNTGAEAIVPHITRVLYHDVLE